jgi:hypothetical protein
MEHAKHLIDLVDKQGNPVGQKMRRDVDKLHDLYHSIHILLVTPLGQLVFSRIPTREDLPNIYTNQLGTTVTTIRRTGETAEQAAARAVSRELFIDEADLHHLDDRFDQLKNGQQSYVSAYYLVADAPEIYSKTDSEGFVTISPSEFRKELINHPERFAPSLVEFWNIYRDRLPL